MAETQRDDEAVRRFVEHFGVTFNDLGFPRMSARVLAAVVAAEDRGLTAGQIAAALDVSAAAVSSALRYLVQFGLVTRTAVPGSRSDVYEVPPDAWYASSVRTRVYAQLADLMEEGVAAVGGEGTLAGDRLADMRDFFAFVEVEFGRMVERWAERRR